MADKVRKPKQDWSASDYILEPWIDRLDYLDKQLELMYEASLIIGKTGQGKTYQTSKNIVPELFKRGHKVVIVSAPSYGILDKDEFDDNVGRDADGNKIKVTDSIDEAMMQVFYGKSVLLIDIHPNLIRYKGKRFINTLSESLPNQFSIIIDEAHSWLVPNPSLYKDDRGHNGAKYKGSLYKLLCTAETNYIFELTATPTNSQQGLITHDGKLKVKIINELPPKHLTIDRLGCLDEIDFFNPEITNDFTNSCRIRGEILDWKERTTLTDLEEQVLYRLREMRELELRTGAKQTMLIRTGIATSKEQLTRPDAVKAMVRELVKRAGFDTSELIFGITTEEGQVLEDATGNNKQEVLNDMVLQSYFDDPDHPVRIMLVMNKCYQGMSVDSIKNIVVWRTTSAEDSSGDPITDFGLQVFGRANRPYAGRFKLKNHTFDSLKDLPMKDKLDIIDLNSINIIAPDTSSFRTIATMFKNTMTSTRKEFSNYFLDGESYYEQRSKILMNHECEQDPCIRCGGTGKEPKNIEFDDNNFDGINKELKIH